MWRQNPRIAVIVSSFVLGVGLFLAAPHAAPQTAAATFEPFIAHSTTEYFGQRDAETPVSVGFDTWARRSDGSKVHLFALTSPNGESGQVVTITDLRRGRDISLEPFTKSATTFYISEKDVDRRRQEEADCLSNFESAEPDEAKIMGVDVVRYTEDDRNDEMDMRMAPDYGCLVLRETSIFRGRSRNEVRIRQLTEGEPPEKMFEVPLDYIERSPSEVEAEYSRKYPGESLYTEEQLQRMDQRYYDSRK